uniref:Uncharacterized protein n=1 Tax=Lactuca sativa TaxID=4236 RepID=A0A9R1V768_LACSA|nr:hypothetical protein LSAT_V11C600298890 [Lactuca sativa]
MQLDPVDPGIRGGYLAFTSQDSPGVLHLKKLSDAGLTHNLEVCRLDMEMLKSLPPDSPEQQEYITAIQNEDGYNWGYNPVLWGVPKGSYSTNPNGSCRIIEPRLIHPENLKKLWHCLSYLHQKIQTFEPQSSSQFISDDMDTSSPSHTVKRLYQMLLDTPMKAIDPKDQTRGESTCPLTQVLERWHQY